MDQRVVIIGGGASGLFCALELVGSGFTNVSILEASDRLGGRIHTIQYQGKALDLGAQWIHGRGDNPLWKYVVNNDIKVMEDDSGGDGDGQFLFAGGRVPDNQIIEQMMTFLDGVHDEIDDLPTDQIQPRSVGEHFQRRFEEFVKTETDLARLKVKKSIFDWYIKWENVDTGVEDLNNQSVSSWGEYIDFDLEEQDTEPILENGYGSLIQHLHDKIKDKVEIRLNSRVTQICWTSDPIQIHIEESSEPLLADHVIVSVSLGVLKHEHNLFNPALPEKKKDAIKLMGFGTMNKIFIGFESPFWEKENGGFQLLWDSEQDCNEHWTRNIPGFDRVCNHGNLLGGWICGKPGRSLEEIPDEEVGMEIWKLLENHTGLKLNNPTFTRVTRWYSDVNFRGSYSYCTPECDDKQIGPWTLASPLEYMGRCKVQFCGEATSTLGYGSVHGAMESGVREARRLIKQYKS